MDLVCALCLSLLRSSNVAPRSGEAVVSTSASEKQSERTIRVGTNRSKIHFQTFSFFRTALGFFGSFSRVFSSRTEFLQLAPHQPLFRRQCRAAPPGLAVSLSQQLRPMTRATDALSASKPDVEMHLLYV